MHVWVQAIEPNAHGEQTSPQELKSHLNRGYPDCHLSILGWAQDCFTHSCADSTIAPVHHERLGLGTVLPRAQACDGVGPAVELPGLRHVVDADDEGQATREECVSQLRVKDQVVAPSRTIVVHAAAGENVRRVSVDALVQSA